MADKCIICKRSDSDTPLKNVEYKQSNMNRQEIWRICSFCLSLAIGRLRYEVLSGKIDYNKLIFLKEEIMEEEGIKIEAYRDKDTQNFIRFSIEDNNLGVRGYVLISKRKPIPKEVTIKLLEA